MPKLSKEQVLKMATEIEKATYNDLVKNFNSAPTDYDISTAKISCRATAIALTKVLEYLQMIELD